MAPFVTRYISLHVNVRSNNVPVDSFNHFDKLRLGDSDLCETDGHRATAYTTLA